jgi:hypothetical protein
MHHFMTSLLWIESGSLHAIHGLLRGLALFWSAGALGEFLEPRVARRRRIGTDH